MKTLFIPTMPDNTNVEHQVILTEGQISTILYYLDEVAEREGITEDIDQIFDILEGAVDEWYELYEPTSESSDEPTYVVK